MGRTEEHEASKEEDALRDAARRPYRDRQINFEVQNAPLRPLSDTYHRLMSGSWFQLLGLCFSAYLVAIAGFAVLFMLGGDCVDNARPGHFPDMFWFSVQTFSTIGYGGMAPSTIYAHVLVTLESFVGLFGVAMGTALIYSRFARPSARVIFTESLVVRERNGVPSLQMRIANERRNQVIDAQVNLSVLVEISSDEGERMRRMIPLRLERERAILFTMTWTLFHTIDEESPLYGLTPENIEDKAILFLATFGGTDDALMQPVFTRRFFLPEDVAFEHRFADVITYGEEHIHLDLGKINDIESL